MGVGVGVVCGRAGTRLCGGEGVGVRVFFLFHFFVRKFIFWKILFEVFFFSKVQKAQKDQTVEKVRFPNFFRGTVFPSGRVQKTSQDLVAASSDGVFQ